MMIKELPIDVDSAVELVVSEYDYYVDYTNRRFKDLGVYHYNRYNAMVDLLKAMDFDVRPVFTPDEFMVYHLTDLYLDMKKVYSQGEFLNYYDQDDEAVTNFIRGEQDE